MEDVLTSQYHWTSDALDQPSTSLREKKKNSADTKTGRRTVATVSTPASTGTGIASNSQVVFSLACTPSFLPTLTRCASRSASYRSTDMPACRTERTAGAETRDLLWTTSSQEENATYIVPAMPSRCVEAKQE